MKKLFAMSLVLILSACAKERTTTLYSTEGANKPISYVLTNEDYEKQQAELQKQKLRKKKDPTVKPADHSENVVALDEYFTAEDLKTLYESYEAPEVAIGAPDGVYEFIGQSRLQKTLGRLTCVKQHPLPDAMKENVSYHCSIDTTHSRDLSLSDKTLYENLNLSEELNEHGYINTQTFIKKAGRFYCEKIIPPSSDVRYECAVQMIAN